MTLPIARAAPMTPIRIMLAGDVMLGRGIDQILPHPSPPAIYERHMTSALDYVELAERHGGAIRRPVSFDYIWGDALGELARSPPDLRIVNLETAVTRSITPAPKGINYRMNPDNAPCLAVAGIDCCVLANNHVLDWQAAGLIETLAALREAGIRTAGAGRDRAEAETPAVLPVGGKGRVLVYGLASASSGVPPGWSARPDRPGVWLLDDFGEPAAGRVADRIAKDRLPGDVVVVSVHWGANWGYRIADDERRFAHRLIKRAGVDVVHGHSSHHPKGFEFHCGRLVLYGCGDLINDYEGIGGYDSYRSDLSLIYLLALAPDGACSALEMLPYRIDRMRLNRATREDAEWLAKRLDRECSLLGGRVSLARAAGADGQASRLSAVMPPSSLPCYPEIGPHRVDGPGR